FDDCYRDILTHGAPILRALNLPACAFVSSGFVDTNRSFVHDETQFPFAFPNLRSADLQAWDRLGLEVGAHTVNHVDLGQCGAEQCRSEILDCGLALESIIGKPVDLFSFPFGGVQHIGDAARSVIAKSRYTAMFSAHGGFLGPRTDPLDIP